MKHFVLPLIFLFVACSGPPCRDANAETGKKIYEQKCLKCHTHLPKKLENYSVFSGHQYQLSDCELQALSAYIQQRDSVKP